MVWGKHPLLTLYSRLPKIISRGVDQWPPSCFLSLVKMSSLHGPHKSPLPSSGLA